MEKKYILTEETGEVEFKNGEKTNLHRVISVKDFDVYAIQFVRVFEGDKIKTKPRMYLKHIKAGDFGGWVESEDNLSQEGTAWVDRNAIVIGKSVVKDDAWVGGSKTIIRGGAVVRDNAIVFSDSNQRYRADVIGEILVRGYSKIMASIKGEGAIKNRLIKRPAVVTLRSPGVKDSAQTLVRFECIVGDKRISRQYEL